MQTFTAPRAFRHSAVSVWNTLLFDIRNAHTSYSFRRLTSDKDIFILNCIRHLVVIHDNKQLTYIQRVIQFLHYITTKNS
jgi:hypothetical protein